MQWFADLVLPTTSKETAFDPRPPHMYPLSEDRGLRTGIRKSTLLLWSARKELCSSALNYYIIAPIKKERKHEVRF